MPDDRMRIGDVISMKGNGVPVELEPMFWRIVEDRPDGWRLDGPYVDQACTQRYHSPAASAAYRITQAQLEADLHAGEQ